MKDQVVMMSITKFIWGLTIKCDDVQRNNSEKRDKVNRKRNLSFEDRKEFGIFRWELEVHSVYPTDQGIGERYTWSSIVSDPRES